MSKKAETYLYLVPALIAGAPGLSNSRVIPYAPVAKDSPNYVFTLAV